MLTDIGFLVARTFFPMGFGIAFPRAEVMRCEITIGQFTDIAFRLCGTCCRSARAFFIVLFIGTNAATVEMVSVFDEPDVNDVVGSLLAFKSIVESFFTILTRFEIEARSSAISF